MSPDEEVPAWVVTALVATGQAVAVAFIIALGAPGGTRHYGAYAFAAAFGALLLLRKRRPVAMLLTAILLIFVYYVIKYPPIGMAVPVVAAFYSVAERGRVVVAAGAGAVFISPATARTYVSRLLHKLDARDRAQLVVIAYRAGVVDD